MNPELLPDYTHVPARELGKVMAWVEYIGKWDLAPLNAEASRVSGVVRWHRPSARPVVAVKVAGRWIARLTPAR